MSVIVVDENHNVTEYGTEGLFLEAFNEQHDETVTSFDEAIVAASDRSEPIVAIIIIDGNMTTNHRGHLTP